MANLIAKMVSNTVFTAHIEKHLEGNFAFTLQRYHISAVEICAAIAVDEFTRNTLVSGLAAIKALKPSISISLFSVST